MLDESQETGSGRNASGFVQEPVGASVIWAVGASDSTPDAPHQKWSAPIDSHAASEA